MNIPIIIFNVIHNICRCESSEFSCQKVTYFPVMMVVKSHKNLYRASALFLTKITGQPV